MADQYTEEHAGLQPAPAVEAPAADTPQADSDAAILQEIRDNRKAVRAYEDLQRKAEAEEEAFEGEDMWDEAARTARAEHVDPETGDLIPAKPTLEAHLLDQNVQQVLSEGRRARLALTVKPKAGIANTKISGYYKGLVRSIQVDSNATVQRLWGLERAIKLGRGGYRVVADYASDGDFDLDLIIERILDYSQVWWDPYAQHPARKDAEWCLEEQPMSEATRKRRWPGKPIIAPQTGTDMEGEYAGWFEPDTENPANNRVLVATYRKVIHTKRTLAFHPTEGQKYLEDLSAEAQAAVKAGAPGTRLREVDERSVMIYIVDGTQVLERRPWHGKYIPMLEIIGREYIVKGKRRFKGIVANAMDILRAINVVLSAAVELGGMLPRSPYMMYAGQDAGFETEWNELFQANRTRIHVNAEDINGKPAPLPQRQVTEIQVQGMLLLLRALHEMYHAVTGSVAPQFRASDPKDRSGKAIDLLQAQAAAGTSGFLDNLASITMPYEGEVLIDAIPHYYDRPGRIVRVMGEENDDETAIMIRRPFIRRNGEPVPVPCPHCHGVGVMPAPILARLFNPAARGEQCQSCEGLGFATRETMPETWENQPVEYVDFSEGQYKVLAVIDRDFKTKQDEALMGMQALAEAVPQMVPLYADLWVRAMAFSGSNEIADRIKAHGPMGQTDEDMEDMPPAFQARYQALKGQHQQALAALEEAGKLLETDAIKTAGQKEIAVIKASLQAKLEGVKLQGKMLQVDKELQANAWVEKLRGDISRLQQESQQRHEIILELLKEQKEKEIERHSVELHDRAAAAAEARLGVREAQGAIREAVAGERDHARAAEESEKDRQHQAQLAREGQAGKERLTDKQLAAQREEDGRT